MTRQDFNIAVAEKVMGWTVTPDDDDPFNDSGFTHHTEDGLVDGPDFHGDHNAAALLRARVAELGKWGGFILALATATAGRHGYTPYNDGTWEFRTEALIELLSASPERIARAAYAAVTKQNLEAVDE